MGYEKPQKNHQDGVKDPNIGPYVTIDEGGEHNDAETDDGLPYFQDETEMRKNGLEPYE